MMSRTSDTKLQHTCSSREEKTNTACRIDKAANKTTSDLHSASQVHGPQILQQKSPPPSPPPSPQWQGLWESKKAIGQVIDK